MARKDDELMSITEAAAAIGVSVATLRRAAKLGTLTAVKIGKTWVTTLSDARRWQASKDHHKRGPKFKQPNA